MIRVVKDMQINRSVEDVFDFLADVRNETRWNPPVIRIEKTSPDPIGKGTRFTGLYKRLGILETKVTTFERPSRLSFHSVGRTLIFDFSFTLAPNPNGTAVHAVADIQLRGLMRLFAPLMQGM